MIPTRLLFTMAFLTLSSGCSSFAAIHLGDPFGEHMVLQQGAQVPIWGSGAPAGDTVRVSIAGQSATARSDWSGSWLVLLGPMKAGGPYQLLIEVGGYGPIIPSSAANSRGGVELNDVLVGEVRIAMERPGRNSSAMRKGEPKTKGNSSAWIRIFEPPAQPADRTRSATHGHWVVDSQYSTAISLKESVYFARKLYEELRIPIGVIDRSVGEGLALKYNDFSSVWPKAPDVRNRLALLKLHISSWQG